MRIYFLIVFLIIILIIKNFEYFEYFEYFENYENYENYTKDYIIKKYNLDPNESSTCYEIPCKQKYSDNKMNICYVCSDCFNQEFRIESKPELQFYTDDIKLINYASYFNYPPNQSKLDQENLKYLKS